MKYIKLISIALILTILTAYLCNNQLFKILIYKKPTTQTFKDFPIRKTAASKQPIHFPQSPKNLKNLDTLKVDYKDQGSIPFSEYFDKGKLLAFIVIRDDSIVYQKYKGGFQESTISNTFSVGKTIISILLGKALEDGYIKTINQKITDFIPELKEKENFKNISIKNLLEMKSGFRFKRTGDGILSDLFSDEAKFYYSDDLKRDLANVIPDTVNGTKWHYSNVDVLLLTWVIERASKKYVSDYFGEEIWEKIGAQYPCSWGVDKIGGLENSPSSFQCTAIDLAKVGRLYLMKGKRDTVSIVPEKWINESLLVSPSNKNNTAKGWQKATHQNYWWIPQDSAKEGDYYADGLRGQRLYINPKTNTIIVQLAEAGYGGFPYRKISHYFSGF
ncbi:serine hydrolase domain-containing protein [Spirosoma aerolatum]|uniref:serine hydrolase domain-containing protein n=1 Tax=Spirosoma aerolatum TaxID=1211326 RepID=UPI0009AC1D4B|nr:serine hydrolase [Spirosoma aerolatum]